MIYLLTVALFLLTVIVYFFEKKDVLSPFVIVCASFALCVGLDALCAEEWNLPMHMNTCIVILSGILSFGAGSYIVENSFFKEKSVAFYRIEKFDIQSIWIVMISLMLLCFLYLNFNEFYAISHKFTTSDNLSVMIRTVIEKLQAGEVKYSTWYTWRMILAQGITYVTLFAFIFNAIYLRTYTYRFLLPVLIFIPLLTVTASRQDFLYLAIFILVSTIFLYQSKNKYNVKKLYKVLGILFCCFCMFLLFFFLSGILSGKIQFGMSPIKVLGHYAGTNISALDVFINQVIIPDDQYFGQITLTKVYNNLRSFGFNVPERNVYISTFVFFKGVSTNVYTAFRRYIQDYGYTGCVFIMFFLGGLYSAFYSFLKYKAENCFYLIIYATYSYPIFLFCREERFMTSILSARCLFTVFIMFLVYTFCIRKSNKGDNANE